MEYHEVRLQELKANNLRRAKELVDDYLSDQDTVIMLPGGGGSELLQSDKSYAKKTPGKFIYDPVWIDIGIVNPFKPDAYELFIKDNGRDERDRIIIPKGSLNYSVKAYDGTKKYFRSLKYNYKEFGFDWRRPIAEWAGFLEEFLTIFRDGVMANNHPNPLPRTTLICHSHGGLIAIQFLQKIFYGKDVNEHDVSQWIDRVITVGTPFYANSNHIKRYYRGEKALPESIYKKKRLAKTMGSMPGPYIFLYLDKESYENDKNTLSNDRHPLIGYPVIDADDQNIEVDPFEESSFRRFPPWVNREYLKAAKEARHEYLKELPDAVKDRIFHLRGINNEKTLIKLRWRNINGSAYDPENGGSPIKAKDEDYGPGDGTVPAWGARLAQIPLDRIYDLKKAKEHRDLMEHEETLKVMEFIIREKRLPIKMDVKNTKYVGVKTESRPSVSNFLLGLEGKTKEQAKTMIEEKAKNPEFVRAIIEEIDFG